jgi:16S rRNA (cytidine1402-2'-O)-methyltransferase
LIELAERNEPFILYESPHRIGKLVEELITAIPGWRMVVGREMTKMYEQIVECSVEEGARLVSSGEIPLKGEFAVLVWSGKKR